jgi:UDP-N-acetylmuramoyl-tripeptide--D-alanyl-D-alanine ligase
VLAAVRPGDVVLVKGSLGSRMAPIVDALKKLVRGSRAASSN